MNLREAATPQQKHAQQVKSRLMGTPSIKPKVIPIAPVQYIPPKPRPKPNRDRMPTWRRIIFEVSEKHQVSYRDIVDGVRTANIVQARDEAAWRMRYETFTSYPQIGTRLGGMDHSSVIRAIERHEDRINA